MKVTIGTMLLLLLFICFSWSEGNTDDVEAFYQLSINATGDGYGYVIDKVKQHRYQEIYGRFLMPHVREVRSLRNNYRFLEIGAGCAIPQKKKGMQVWNTLFDREGDKIYVAELKWRCIEKMKREGTVPDRIQILIGDQADPKDLGRWSKETGGNLDAIVDDGSHKNHHIYRSLMTLWHSLAPGGLYFIEDLQVSRQPDYMDTENLGKPSPLYMSDVIKDFQEQLMVPDSKRVQHWQYKVLPDLKGIFCQFEACVLIKCRSEGELAKCT